MAFSRGILAAHVAALAVASRDPASDAAAACAKLNITEQMSMMRGYGQINGYSRNSGCADVCGRATFRWDNGPQGFGDGTIPGTTTQFPCSLAVAATWDVELAESFGVSGGPARSDFATSMSGRATEFTAGFYNNTHIHTYIHTVHP